MNLLTETLDMITRVERSVADIVYIGSRNGYACTWEEFTKLADREYDDGYGSVQVAKDLEVHFSDGSWLERDTYDGSESWSFRSPLVIPAETKRIERVMQDDDHYESYLGLAGLHEDDDE